MLKIRLQRTGKINQPSYRIVVTEHTRGPKAANFVEKLGTYNPKTKERNLNEERIKYWLSVGAKASGTMHNILISAGVIEGKKVNVLPKKSPPSPAEASAKEGQEAASAPDSARATTGEEGSGEPREEIPASDLKDDPQAAADMVAAEANKE